MEAKACRDAAEMRKRYRKSTRAQRGRLLDEFTAVSGYHRKYAMMLLGPRADAPHVKRNFSKTTITTLGKATPYSVMAALSGCGGPQPPIGALGAMQQSTGVVGQKSAAAIRAVVYRVMPTSSYHVVYRFEGRHDSANPYRAGLINVNGTLYGVTTAGGADDRGTVFSVTKTGKEHDLYSFAGGSDGASPPSEIEALLHEEIVGRIGYVDRRGLPYIVPFTYAYDGHAFYGYSLLGAKIENMGANPRVCVEVDRVQNAAEWCSVIVRGTFERLEGALAIDAVERISERLRTVAAATAAPVEAWRTFVARSGGPGIAYRIKITQKHGRIATAKTRP